MAVYSISLLILIQFYFINLFMQYSPQKFVPYSNGKRYKPLRMLSNSSMTAISNALLEDFGIKSSGISESL